MFKGFTLKDKQLAGFFTRDCRMRGQADTDALQELIRKQLHELADTGAVLSGTKIQDNWFPEIEADVFISHSHKNIDQALGLAGWLESRFNLTAFVDSVVWGYAEDLLRIIDNHYCRNDDEKTYDYHKRNGSTSHIHMMLTTALAKMIDKTECLIFLNTPNSISCSDAIDKTKSPWIYAELTTASIIRRTAPNRRGWLKAAGRTGHVFENRNLEIEYDLNTKSLPTISTETLKRWEEEHDMDSGIHALDTFYLVTEQL